MEDISRELEREIARAKPTPYKTNRKKKVLVVNDFGEMKSGAYLSVLVRILAVTSLIFGVAAVGLYTLYAHQADENAAMKERLAVLEKKKNQLTNEKEILMAQLVMAGDKPILQKAGATTNQGQAAAVKEKKPEVRKAKQEIASTQPAQKASGEQVEPVRPEQKVETVEASEARDVAQTGVEAENPAEKSPDMDKAADTDAPDSQVIAVEKFSVSQSPNHNELRVRFNIRNIKEGPGEISGRIFLVLKPEGGGVDEWIVAPKAPLAENGIPLVYKRGQYFSISRFKPVQFTINSPVAPDRLKTAGVYIFDDEGQLIFNDTVETSLDEEE